MLLNSCIPEKEIDINEIRKQEILKVVQDFLEMAAKDGIPKAFLHFAADDAFTYGEYLYIVTDPKRNVQQEKRIFHTLWKKQDESEWRFIWD